MRIKIIQNLVRMKVINKEAQFIRLVVDFRYAFELDIL